MFIPNLVGQHTARTGHNAHGEPIFASVSTNIACAIVHLDKATDVTSVRSDSSASRANAREQLTTAKILIVKTATVSAGDKFTISGATMRIVGVEPRYAVTGNLDHYECDMERWPN